MNAEDVVREYWRLMATNDFAAVAAVLAHDFVLEWPQSNERIRGAANFVRMNAEYPSHGPWRFEVHRIVASQTTAVSDVGVTDGVQTGRALSFFHCEPGQDLAPAGVLARTLCRAGQQGAPCRTDCLNRARVLPLGDQSQTHRMRSHAGKRSGGRGR